MPGKDVEKTIEKAVSFGSVSFCFCGYLFRIPL